MATAMASRHLGNRSATTAFFTGPHERRVVPLHSVPAPHRYRFPFRRKFSERAGAARWGTEGLRARRRQRLSDSISFLPELRHHALLGGRPQSCGLRSGRGRFRYLDFPAAQRLDLGGVDASMARAAAEYGAPSAGPTTSHLNCVERSIRERRMKIVPVMGVS